MHRQGGHIPLGESNADLQSAVLEPLEHSARPALHFLKPHAVVRVQLWDISRSEEAFGLLCDGEEDAEGSQERSRDMDYKARIMRGATRAQGLCELSAGPLGYTHADKRQAREI